MGRPRGFVEHRVVENAAALFTAHGYEATSIDDLVAATGLHRGSLYKAFGSKRGLFLAALTGVVEGPTASSAVPERADLPTLDLILVAALELAPRDDEIRELVRRGCERLAADPGGAEVAAVLGRRLLHRAGALTSPIPSAQRG